MAFIVTVTPGTTWTTNDDVTAAKLNSTANPTMGVTGSSRDLSDVVATVGTEGQILVYRTATAKWTPETLPVANSDVPNRLFMWAHFS